jgi:protein phosphatase
LKIDNYGLIVGNATDVGKVRRYNEDYMAHFGTVYGYCIIVCDGMGGHAAGHVASRAAVDAIRHYLQDGKITRTDTANALINAIEFANFRLREMVAQKPELAGMGTTCVIALIKNDELFVAHAGDSRLYFIRGNDIEQVSRDHSTVQDLIDAGVLTEDEALQSEKRNQITKAIGIFEKVGASVIPQPIKLVYNDKILLCSDGLTTHLSDKEILELINQSEDVQVAASLLMENANHGGGSDNITVQLVHYIRKPASRQESGYLGNLFNTAFALLFNAF